MGCVSLVHCDSYESPTLDLAVEKAVALSGGLGDLIKPGDRVLIKPNMLSAHAPEACITTNPAVVRTVARMVLDIGAKPFIADSPALDRFQRVAAKTGIGRVAEDLGLEIRALDQPKRISTPECCVFRSLEISTHALEADVVINLPKLKTHSQMLLTLGVKNLFGTVVAQRKAEWHAMVGANRINFGSLLLDIHHVVAPAITIMDGIWGMEGRGPGNGDPRFIGVLAASRNTLALDIALCRLLRVPLERFPLYRAAKERGLIDSDVEDPGIMGDSLDNFEVSDFRLPELGPIRPISGKWGDWLARQLASKPVQDTTACIGCEKCVGICASHAVVMNDRKLVFDYDRCIRCYCCQEVCPENAIDFKHGLLARFLNIIGR